MTDSTPTLTHERAAAVRLASDPTAHFDTSFRLGLITSSDVATAAATQLGRQALAKYDAEWVTVSRASLLSVLTDVPHEAPHEVAHVIAERLRVARSALANAAGCVLGSDDAGGIGSEYVAVRREHLEELRDVAQAAVNEHAQTFAGYPIELSRMAPAEQAIAHANEVLATQPTPSET